MPDETDHDPSEFHSGGLVKPFLDHLEDLRWTLIKCVIALGAAVSLCLFFVRELLQVLYQPLIWAKICDSPQDFLVAIEVVSPWSVAFKVGIYGGLLLSIPLMLYFVGQFILPALTKKERGYLWPAFAAGGVMFLAGVAFCYFVLMPQTLAITWQFGTYLGWKMQWTVQSYVSFVVRFSIAMGLGFELPVLILILVRLGVLSSATLRRFRRHVIVINVIAAAAITPGSDLLSLALVAGPMCLLYEACIWIAWLMRR